MKTEPTKERRLHTALRRISLEELARLDGEQDNDEEFSKRVREAFEKGIITTYRNAIEESLFEQNLRRADIGVALAKDSGLTSKWRRQIINPDFETLFLALAAFDVEPKGLGLPRGRIVVRQAVRQTMFVIRSELLGEECSEPSREAVECLFEADEANWVEAMLKGGSEPRKAAKHISKEVTYLVGKTCTFTPKDIRDIMLEWKKPMILFFKHIPFNWRF